MPKEKSSNDSKKMLRKEISSQVENALPQLKALLGSEKFEARLKKAVKILTEDLPVQQPDEVKEKATLPKKAKAALPKKEKPLASKEKEVKAKAPKKSEE